MVVVGFLIGLVRDFLGDFDIICVLLKHMGVVFGTSEDEFAHVQR